MQKDNATELIAHVARTYGLSLVILFGSQATGHTHKESDYDIGCISKVPLSFAQQGMLIYALITIVHVSDERCISLVNLRTAPPLLLHLATSNARVLYENEPTVFPRLQAYAFARYIETLPIREANYRRLQEIYSTAA